MPWRRARHGKASVSRASDPTERASIVMMFSGAMISSISTLARICVKQRKCSVASGKQLARFSERRVGHDHRPHLGELDEQDVARPTGGRAGESEQALDAVHHGEEKRERDPDPEVDGTHELRSQRSLRIILSTTSCTSKSPAASSVQRSRASE